VTTALLVTTSLQTLIETAHHRIEGIDLHADEVTKVIGAVTADMNPADVPGWLPKLVFIRTSLGVHDQQLLVIGRLQKHIEEFESVEGVKISTVYEALHASITQKTGFSQEGAGLKEMLARKSLSKGELDELFKRAISRGRGILEDWGDHSRRLGKEWRPFHRSDQTEDRSNRVQARPERRSSRCTSTYIVCRTVDFNACETVRRLQYSSRIGATDSESSTGNVRLR
jgi:hypothetical protein